MIEFHFQASEENGEKNPPDLLGRIDGLRKSLSDWSPALRAIAREVLASFAARQFETQGEAGGVKWADLAPSTLRARKRPGALSLYRTGSLLRSFLGLGAEHVEDLSEKKLLWGSSVPYARFHQSGTGKGFGRSEGVPTGRGTGRGMPMRKILAFSESMRADVESEFIARLAPVARQAGFGIRFGDL